MLVLDWEGCSLQVAEVLISSGITVGRDQNCSPVLLPPLVTAKAALSKSWGNPKAHVLPCVLHSTSLNRQVLPYVSSNFILQPLSEKILDELHCRELDKSVVYHFSL